LNNPPFLTAFIGGMEWLICEIIIFYCTYNGWEHLFGYVNSMKLKNEVVNNDDLCHAEIPVRAVRIWGGEHRSARILGVSGRAMPRTPVRSGLLQISHAVNRL
jgi:hypothetical protein